MTTSDKVVVVEGEERIVAVQELRVEDNLNSIGRMVEQVDSSDLVQDWIFGIIGHVVRDDRWQGVSLQCIHSSLEQDLLLRCHQLGGVWDFGAGFTSVPGRTVKEPSPHVLLDLLDSALERLGDGLSFQGLHAVGSRGSGHDDECDNGLLGSRCFHLVVQSSHGLDEHVDTLVSVLVSTGGEEVQSVVKVEIVVTVKVTANKVVDLLLRCLMQVLELVHGRELDDVHTVGQDSIRFSLEQMFRFVRRDVRDSREDVRGMCGCSFDTVSMVDTSLSGLMVDIEVLEVVVEVDTTGTKISSEQGCVSGEDCRDVDSPLSTEGQGHTS